MSAHQHAHTTFSPPDPPYPALIADCELVCHEASVSQMLSVRDSIFEEEAQWGADGSPFARWYRQAASGVSGERVIAWKTDAEFEPKRLFFRSRDTGRLLTMELADFRPQVYAHRNVWARYAASKKGGGINGALKSILLMHMHDILLLRNFHDLHAGDIPFVTVDWSDDTVQRVLDYYVALSKPDHDADALKREFFTLAQLIHSQHGLPCLCQTDILLRALFSDPAVGYLPPFVVFVPEMGTDYGRHGKARALFRTPHCMPPSALLESFPTICGAPRCEETDCGAFCHSGVRALHAGSDLVRRAEDYEPVVLCNLWGCKATQKLSLCGKCKEVRYCSAAHQKADWGLHKLVCEAR